MLKWLFLFALGYVAYRWLSHASASKSSSPTQERVEQMVKCAQCGIHFPQNEAVLDEGHHFCCEQHCAAWKQGR